MRAGGGDATRSLYFYPIGIPATTTLRPESVPNPARVNLHVQAFARRQTPPARRTAG